MERDTGRSFVKEVLTHRRNEILSVQLTFKEKYEALFAAKHRKYNQLKQGIYVNNDVDKKGKL